jgi:hypothetical protein
MDEQITLAWSSLDQFPGEEVRPGQGKLSPYPMQDPCHMLWDRKGALDLVFDSCGLKAPHEPPKSWCFPRSGGRQSQ